MEGIITAVIVVTGIGILCAVMLVLAAKFMSVKVNKKIEEIRACLPGANCGACGFSGCDGYAKALAEDPTVKTNLCVPGADAVSKQLSELMGVEFEDVIEQVATIHCGGDCNATELKNNYTGVQSCAAAAMLYGGPWKCKYGCLGFGDCVSACPNGAICLTNGIAHFDSRKCTGCGLCVKACPHHLITLMPDIERVVITCSSIEKGADVRKICTHGCIGCKKCEKTCPHDAIKVVNNLAVIDYDKCNDCIACAKGCPTGCIMISDFSGIHRFTEEKPKTEEKA